MDPIHPVYVYSLINLYSVYPHIFYYSYGRVIISFHWLVQGHLYVKFNRRSLDKFEFAEIVNYGANMTLFINIYIHQDCASLFK